MKISKKVICCVLIVLICAAALTSCTKEPSASSPWIFGRLFELQLGTLSDEWALQNALKSLLRAVESGSVDSAKALFAPNAVNELGEEQLCEMLEALLQYYSGTLTQVTSPLGPNCSESIRGALRQKELYGPINVSTTENEYRIAMKYVFRDDFDKGNEGIWSVYLIEKAKDVESPYPYRGDLNYTTGIFFDVPRPQ